MSQEQEGEGEESFDGEYEYLDEPQLNKIPKRKTNNRHRDNRRIISRLENLAERNKKNVNELAEELFETHNWIQNQLKQGRVITSFNLNGKIKGAYTLENKRDKIRYSKNKILALITDPILLEYLNVGRYQSTIKEGVFLIDYYHNEKLETYDFLQSQIEFYLRKPSIIELDPNSILHKMTFKRFIKKFEEFKGDKDKLKKDYKKLFEEKLPKLAYNKFRLYEK